MCSCPTRASADPPSRGRLAHAAGIHRPRPRRRRLQQYFQKVQCGDVRSRTEPQAEIRKTDVHGKADEPWLFVDSSRPKSFVHIREIVLGLSENLNRIHVFRELWLEMGSVETAGSEPQPSHHGWRDLRS